MGFLKDLAKQYLDGLISADEFCEALQDHLSMMDDEAMTELAKLLWLRS